MYTHTYLCYIDDLNSTFQFDPTPPAHRHDCKYTFLYTAHLCTSDIMPEYLLPWNNIDDILENSNI